MQFALCLSAQPYSFISQTLQNEYQLLNNLSFQCHLLYYSRLQNIYLLQDFAFLDEMAHFDRERIPERVVHAKGAGA